MRGDPRNIDGPGRPLCGSRQGKICERIGEIDRPRRNHTCCGCLQNWRGLNNRRRTRCLGWHSNIRRGCRLRRSILQHRTISLSRGGNGHRRRWRRCHHCRDGRHGSRRYGRCGALRCRCCLRHGGRTRALHQTICCAPRRIGGCSTIAGDSRITCATSSRWCNRLRKARYCHQCRGGLGRRGIIRNGNRWPCGGIGHRSSGRHIWGRRRDIRLRRCRRLRHSRRISRLGLPNGRQFTGRRCTGRDDATGAAFGAATATVCRARPLLRTVRVVLALSPLRPNGSPVGTSADCAGAAATATPLGGTGRCFTLATYLAARGSCLPICATLGNWPKLAAAACCAGVSRGM